MPLLLVACSSSERAIVTVEEPSAVTYQAPDTTRLVEAPPVALEGTLTEALDVRTYDTPDTTSPTQEVRAVSATDSTLTIDTPRRSETYRLPALGETLRLVPDSGGMEGQVSGTKRPRTTEVDVPQSDGWSTRTWILVGGGFVLCSLGLIALIKIL
jgi:hypothetical protein